MYKRQAVNDDYVSEWLTGPRPFRCDPEHPWQTTALCHMPAQLWRNMEEVGGKHTPWWKHPQAGLGAQGLPTPGTVVVDMELTEDEC